MTPNDTAQRSQLLAQLSVAAEKVRAIRAMLDDADVDLNAAIEAAREADIPWAQIEELTGLTQGQLQWRWHRDDPANTGALERRREERAAQPPKAPKPRPGRGPGVSVTEAARRLGLTRKAIYLRIERGALASTENELGQTRVLLPDEPDPAPQG